MCRLLYFPYISIPNASWLVQALLYWDGVATIVPTDYLEYPDQFSSFARELVQENIIQTVQPEEYAYSYYDEFMTFLKWARAHAPQFRLNRIFRRNQNISQTYLHAGKIGDILGSEFMRLGFARRSDDQWYEMTEQLSMAFMTFLAILIGREENYVPMTDSCQGMLSLFDATSHPASTSEGTIRDALRTTMLNDIFPVPSNMNNLSDLLRFRDKYHDELQRFRRHIENFLISLDGLSEDLQRERCRNFQLEIQDELKEIKGHMGWFRAPKINFGTVMSALPSVYGAISGDPVSAGIGVGAVFGQMIWNSDRNENLRKPLAYAALYQNRFHGRQGKLHM